MMYGNDVFAVFDSKVGAYNKAFILRSKGEARRLFSDLANNSKSEIGKHPEDYTLFHLGTYDDMKGTFKNNDTPVSMGVAIEYVKEDNKVVDLIGGSEDEK